MKFLSSLFSLTLFITLLSACSTSGANVPDLPSQSMDTAGSQRGETIASKMIAPVEHY